MSAYYNEIDPYAAEWLRNLIKQGHIADGVVDDRSISDVRPEELFEFTQCHFFAGIGIWSRALRGAGWADERPVWTGSCPCQPFSGAGKRAGASDERHLWPHWNHLIQECRPSTIFGEQVASKDGLGWLDLVQTDMEAKDYAFGAFDLSASGFGAPHIRQRLWFVADTDNAGSQGWIPRGPDQEREDQHGHAGRNGATHIGVGNTDLHDGRHGDRALTSDGQARVEHGSASASDGMDRGPSGKTNGHWRDADWLFCRDGKWRPVEPNTCPLVDGATSRVGRLRAYGNGIVPQVAQGLIESYMETREEV
jgi:DNA (cytosine-5)-methyltransferase 1